MWSDGSAEAGVSNGGGGAIISTLDGQQQDILVPVGRLCSSTRAELFGLLAALEAALDLTRCRDLPVVVCLDSKATLMLLAGGAADQTSPLGVRLWARLRQLESSAPAVHLCGAGTLRPAGK